MTIDTQLTVLLHSLLPHSPLFLTLFMFLSLTGSYAAIWLVAGLVVFWRDEERDHRFILRLSLTLLATFVATEVLKLLVARPRPTALFAGQALCPADFAFPSLHAALAVAGALVLARADKKRRYFYYTAAVLIAYSRIYLGCHFAGDVVFGALLGAFVTFVGFQLQKGQKKKRK
jgi:undecaprenyl-diphosphatase